MQAKFNIEIMDKKPTRPYLMNTYDRPHSANPKWKLYEYDGKKTVTQLHKMVYQYYDKSDF